MLTDKQQKELDKHLGLGRHTKAERDIMREEMMKGKSVKAAHNVVTRRREKMKKKTGEVELDGEKVKFKEGGLRNQLKVPKDYKFKKSQLQKLAKMETGSQFDFLGKEFKMTKLMKQRINFAITLMSRKK